MNKVVRRVLFVLLLLIFLVSAAMLAYRTMEYRKGEETYADAAELVDLPTLPPAEETQPEPPPATAPSAEKPKPKPDPYAKLLKNMDFTALREVNEEVFGWILIPNTALSYPLLQGKDNDYYLSHSYKKTTSAVGAIFLDSRCSATLSDFNTIIYGHRMNNGSMFASLKHYKTQSYADKHPDIYISRAEGAYRYTIFSAYEGSASGEGYRLGIQTAASKQAFLDSAVGASLIKTKAAPTVEDRVLTLSTCTGGSHAKRWIVHAVLTEFTPAK